MKEENHKIEATRKRILELKDTIQIKRATSKSFFIESKTLELNEKILELLTQKVKKDT